jgi:adenylosuccinate synthase
VARLEELIDKPLSLISVGPERESMFDYRS